MQNLSQGNRILFEIRTEHPLSTSRECYRYLNPSGYSFVICNARQTNVHTYHGYANNGYLNKIRFLFTDKIYSHTMIDVNYKTLGRMETMKETRCFG
jgi:hypothetical protein